MFITHAETQHLPQLTLLDPHISESELGALVTRHRVLIAEEDGKLVGWLRWNLFWDNTPFMNMLYVFESARGKGIGRELTLHWEEEMRLLGYQSLMTSTASDEYAQHFYRKLGYETIGGFAPFGEAYELILSKRL